MATYTFATARDVVASRTFQSDTTKLGYELNAAIQWAFNRVFNSAKGPDCAVTFSDEDSQASRIRELSLATATGATTLMGVKKLWLKMAGDSTFSEMIPLDANDPLFALGDDTTTADTSVSASSHPVFYTLINNQTVRFSPAVPAGSVVRTDYHTFVTLGALTGLADVIHNAIISKATSLVFLNMDDERWAVWNGMAERELTDAIHVLNRTTTGPTRTRPFRGR